MQDVGQERRAEVKSEDEARIDLLSHGAHHKLQNQLNQAHVDKNRDGVRLDGHFLEDSHQESLVDTAIFGIRDLGEDLNQGGDDHLVVAEEILDAFKGASHDTNQAQESMPQSLALNRQKVE